jgi:hypothetical protein
MLNKIKLQYEYKNMALKVAIHKTVNPTTLLETYSSIEFLEKWYGFLD